MSRPFDYFVIFAEMRTGSNFLESNLDQFSGLKCFGEAFNPYFMVSPKTTKLFDVTVAMRDADPLNLLARIRENTSGLPGFRFFHDHDPRVFDALMDDPRCAKIVLTRNLVEAYLSRKIAWETDQWQLSNAEHAIKKKARFDGTEFEKLFYRMKGFQQKIKERLQVSGQTAFYIDYEDAQKIDVINGLAKFLGETEVISEFAGTFKKQNPEPISEKVQNYDELVKTVSAVDTFDLHRLPNFEPSRAPVVGSYVASEAAPLVFLPVRGGPNKRVMCWLEGLGALNEGFTQKTLRHWKRHHKGHRSFTVLRHPVARLHATFCEYLVSHGPETYTEIKRALRENYDVALPEDEPGADWDKRTHTQAFLKFAEFVSNNLKGQTSIRVDAAWASQVAVLQGFADFALPDHVLREDQLATALPQLLEEVGSPLAQDVPAPLDDTPFTLQEIYNSDIETAVRQLYQRDYMMFGFKPWNK